MRSLVAGGGSDERNFDSGGAGGADSGDGSGATGGASGKGGSTGGSAGDAGTTCTSSGWTGSVIPACGAYASYTYCQLGIIGGGGCTRVTESTQQQCR